MILSWKTIEKSVTTNNKQINAQTPASCHIHHLHNAHIVCLYICILCIHIMSMCLPSICMPVQTVEVCVHVEMQLQLIYGFNTVNTHFTIILFVIIQIINALFHSTSFSGISASGHSWQLIPQSDPANQEM
jgi:hypothetical protein